MNGRSMSRWPKESMARRKIHKRVTIPPGISTWVVSAETKSDPKPKKTKVKLEKLEIYGDRYLSFRERVLTSAIRKTKEKPGFSFPETVLYFTDPLKNSDKEYRIRIILNHDFPKKNWYNVEFAHGKRGFATTYKLKTIEGPVQLPEAKRILDDLVVEKKKKGYTTKSTGVPFS